MLAAMRWVVGRLPRGLRASDADRPVSRLRPSPYLSGHPSSTQAVTRRSRRKIDPSVVQRLLSGLSAISPREKHCRSDVFACAFQLAWLQTLPATLVPRAGPVALWGLASCARAVIFRGQMPSATRAL